MCIAYCLHLLGDSHGFCGEQSSWTLGLLLFDVLLVPLVHEVPFPVCTQVLAVQAVACHGPLLRPHACEFSLSRVSQ